MDGQAIASLLGGIGLFLLGMELMTEGLKLAAGPALERILRDSTATRLRGLAAGALVTALVQSSSAVTVATIGFVNAGLLSLGQSLWVLFGSNVGTTMTGWLVALVGLKIKIDALALPLIGIGMALRLSGGKGRRAALGMALAGFGVLFLGIDLLKNGFSGVASGFSLREFEGMLGVLVMVLSGILMTVLMQASAAALVLTFTAAESGMLSIEAAAAVVIGANVGTTVTALIAAFGATPNAKRAASAHVLFNVITGVVALLLLPLLIGLLALLRNLLELDPAPAAFLALFHSAFNILGVLLMWPLADRLAAFLQHRFRTAEEDEARPQYLDGNLLGVPALALDALQQEVRRMGIIALRMLRDSHADAERLRRERQAVQALNHAVAEFVMQLSRSALLADSAQRLPQILRIARYYETLAELAHDMGEIRREFPEPALPEAARFTAQAEALLDSVDPARPKVERQTVEASWQTLQTHYQQLKDRLLQAGAQGELSVTEMEASLRRVSMLRRAAEQGVKAALMLGGEGVPR